MHRFRHVVIAGVVTAVALASFAAPASAGPGKATIGIVNGIPGVRVDICLGGKELSSAVKYGAAVAKVVQAGAKQIQVREASPGVCTGPKIAQKTENLPVGADRTLVITKKAPKWVKFDNSGLGQIWPVGAPLLGAFVAFRHAADLGTVAGRYSFPFPIAPTAETPWVEGDQLVAGVGVTDLTAFSLGFGRIDKAAELARSKMTYLKDGHRYEFYLLGTGRGNAKVMVWSREVTAPGP